jgi:molybdate transport system substrate-binding protein
VSRRARIRLIDARAAAAAAALATAVAGCGSSSSGGSATGSSPSPASSSAAALSGKITVLAAASLTESFTTLGKRFEAAHPGATVVFSFGASSTLATQVTNGAPADVFASASTKNMDQVVAAKDATASVTFAKNAMEVAVPPVNPAKITQLSDLARPGVKVALCAPAVPCGSLARTVLAHAHLSLTPVTEEVDVKATLTKVELGEVDAGMVYVTDVRAAGGKVTGVQIPADVNAATSYPMAILSASQNADLARAFVNYVTSDAGEVVLTAAGFQKP